MRPLSLNAVTHQWVGGVIKLRRLRIGVYIV